MTPKTPLVTVSLQFRIQAIRSVLAIGLFVLVYLLLLAFAVSSVYFACLGAWALLNTFLHPITIIASLSMMIAAGLFVYFMLKFLFHRSVTDNTDDIEVTRGEEPRLFAMIDDIVNRLGVKPPRKVFLGPEVNASVTYNSSFWSMFLPVRKNLRIGMGLINSMHEDELRAVIAHEFGHFSQRSMAVGSYVYNVNYVIFQLVDDDQNLTQAAHGIATSSVFIFPFAMAAIYAVQVTRWILTKMYGLVNLSYLSLIREMEYHADAVAASLGSGHALASGLRRFELAGACYNNAVGFTATQLADNQRVGNLYGLQTWLLKDTARRDGLTMTNGLPEVSGEDNNRYLKSKIEASQQWASHPEMEDRIAHLQLDPINTSQEARSLANGLLTNHKARQQGVEATLQQELDRFRRTDKLFDQHNEAIQSISFVVARLALAYGGEISNRSLSERVKAFRGISCGRGRAPSVPKEVQKLRLHCTSTVHLRLPLLGQPFLIGGLALSKPRCGSIKMMGAISFLHIEYVVDEVCLGWFQRGFISWLTRRTNGPRRQAIYLTRIIGVVYLNITFMNDAIPTV